jgi:alcohol dehydrogenase
MPASVTAATGIDALSHAVESYVCTRRNPVSQLFSRQAWQLLVQGFPAVIVAAADIGARSKMLLGAHLAGAAIENSMLGAAHALANPLSAHFDVTHGLAIAVMLPHVVRFNAQAIGGLYGDLAGDARLCAAENPRAGEILAAHLTDVVAKAGLPGRLAECGVDRAAIPQMAAEAAQQWTGQFNPRPVDEQSLRQLYEGAM